LFKPIIENDNINFDNFFNLIRKRIKNILRLYIIIATIFTIYFFVKTPYYSSELSFYTNYTPSSQTSLSLSFLPGNFGDLMSDNLNFSISDYINSKKFLQGIVEKQYQFGEKKGTLIEVWGSTYNNFLTINPLSFVTKINNNVMINKNLSEEEKKAYFARAKLKSSIKFSEDRVTSLNTITVITKRHSNLSEEILINIYESIINYYSEVNNTKAFEKKQFINERLSEVKSELKKSEEKMISFLEKNKDSNSPTLTLKKASLQREINLYSQLYVSLSDQLEIAKIDEKDNTSSIFLLDAPNVSSNKVGISLLKGLIYIFILCFLGEIVFRMYRHRRQLFLK